MEASEYQKKAHTFATYGEGITYPSLGLCEEAGEVAGKIAKFIRKNNGHLPNFSLKCDEQPMEKLRDDVKRELGDCCWFIAELATFFNLELGDILQTNIDKLSDRKARGVIVGEGDNR